MLEALNKNFGLLIGFVLPGFVFLVLNIAIESNEPFDWQTKMTSVNEIGGLLLLLLASTAIGVIISAIRWLTLDSVLHATGLEPPQLDYRNLEIKQASFMLVVENNYRYYLFYGNTFIAVLVAGLTVYANELPFSRLTLVRWIAVCIVLFLASRDSLRRFYTRSRLIMGEAPSVRKQKGKKYY